MSSFSDNFSRDENKDTQYDDSAVYSFVGTILLVSILPLLWAIYKRIFFSKELLDNKKYSNCQCKSCKQRVKKHYTRVEKRNYNYTFFLYIFLVLLLAYLFYLSYFEIVKNGSNFKSFNPYEILEIEPESDLKVIKKAYRRLSLLFHPDKNPNNLQAKAKFIMIAKAYESLTDEVARKNFELYGNPDGPGSMRLAVGLPSFVLNKKNHMPILFLFLIIIIVVIPGFVWFWFSNSNKYDDSGMVKNDNGIFLELLNENILLRQMPFVLGMAIEFNSFKIRKEEAEELEKLWKAYKEFIVKIKEEMIPFPNRKAFCLIYAYLNNVTITTPSLLNDLDEILKIAPILISNMYGITNEMTKMHMMVDKRYKNFGYNCAKTILEFSQCIHQQMNFAKDASPLLQLPHFNENHVKNFKLVKPKTLAGEQKKSILVLFLELPVEERLKMLTDLGFNKEQIEDIETCVKTFPRYNLKIETFVEGFEEILLEDLLTIKCTIERGGVDDDNIELGVSHSRKFPELFKEKTLLILKIGENRIVFDAFLDIDKKVTVHEFKHQTREIGIFKFEAELISFNFKGLDIQMPFEITVVKSSEKRSDFIKSLEKKEVKLEPSYFQQMLNQVIPINDDDEEEEEEEETPKTEGEEKSEDINDEKTKEQKAEEEKEAQLAKEKEAVNSLLEEIENDNNKGGGKRRKNK